MKYKGILVFLIFCLIVVSCALITFAIMSKDTQNVSSNINSTTNVKNTTNEIKDLTNISKDDLKNEANTRDENNTEADKEASKQEQSKQEDNSNTEEEIKETVKSKQEKQDIAVNLTKQEWGEDDTVYYTIDREVDNIYDISVRSKSTTETLAEYEVDIVNKTVQIK